KLKAALGKMELSVSTGYYKDETASLCQYVAPDNHFLESWDLVECEKGKYSFVQPTIAPVFETRQGQVSLALWSDNAAFGKGEEDYYNYIRNYFKTNVMPLAGASNLDTFWNESLHNGIIELPAQAAQVPSNNILASSLVEKIATKVPTND